MRRGMPYEQSIREIMHATGSTREQAEFIYAIETGELDGDLIGEGGPQPLTDEQRRRVGLGPNPKPQRQQ